MEKRYEIQILKSLGITLNANFFFPIYGPCGTGLHSLIKALEFRFKYVLGVISSYPTVKVKVRSLSRVRLFVTPWTVAYQAPQSMEFSRQQYWSGLPFPSPRDLPGEGRIKPGSPALQTDALPSEPPGKTLIA